MIFITDNFETPSGPYMRFRGYLKDCRECPLTNKCMKREVKNQGRKISVLIDSKRKVTHLDRMRKVIDSEDGKAMYSKRMHTIGSELLLHSLHFRHPWRSACIWKHLQHKGLDKLSLRSEVKVTAQWRLYCLVHNVEKLWRYAT